MDKERNEKYRLSKTQLWVHYMERTFLLSYWSFFLLAELSPCNAPLCANAHRHFLQLSNRTKKRFCFSFPISLSVYGRRWWKINTQCFAWDILIQLLTHQTWTMDSAETIDQIAHIPTDHTQKMIFTAILITASGIVNLPTKLTGTSNCEFLSEVYICVVFVCFSFGMGLLLLSTALPRGPISVSLAKKLVWILLAVVRLWPLEPF